MGPSPTPHVPQTVGSQIGNHRSSTSCGVVERPDHHYGEDLVNTFHTVDFDISLIRPIWILLGPSRLIAVYLATKFVCP